VVPTVEGSEITSWLRSGPTNSGMPVRNVPAGVNAFGPENCEEIVAGYASRRYRKEFGSMLMPPPSRITVLSFKR
jgi:hypothetical protein